MKLKLILFWLKKKEESFERCQGVSLETATQVSGC